MTRILQNSPAGFFLTPCCLTMALLVTTGCSFFGDTTKYPTAEPCSGSGILEGTWTTATQVGVIYDKISYDNDTTACRSQNYDFQIQIAGNREPDPVLNMTVWGGIFESGDIESRDWQIPSPWTTNDASFFESFTSVSGATYGGEIQLSCGTSDDVTFTCHPVNDFYPLLTEFTITMDATDPNKATVNLPFNKGVFLGDADTTAADKYYRCSDSEAQMDTVTIVRTDTSSEVLDNDMIELADYMQVTCPTSQETSPASPDRATTYNGKNVLQWLKLVRDLWTVNKGKTLAEQKSAAHAAIAQYVLAPERTKVTQFVDDVLTNYNLADPAACYLPQLDAHCRVKLLVDSAYDNVQTVDINNMTSKQHAVVDNTAWAFGKMYVAWVNGH